MTLAPIPEIGMLQDRAGKFKDCATNSLTKDTSAPGSTSALTDMRCPVGDFSTTCAVARSTVVGALALSAAVAATLGGSGKLD